MRDRSPASENHPRLLPAHAERVADDKARIGGTDAGDRIRIPTDREPRRRGRARGGSIPADASLIGGFSRSSSAGAGFSRPNS
jgi:hypothetical protein